MKRNAVNNYTGTTGKTGTLPGKLEPMINLVIGVKLQLYAEITSFLYICGKNTGRAFTKKNEFWQVFFFPPHYTDLFKFHALC